MRALRILLLARLGLRDLRRADRLGRRAVARLEAAGLMRARLTASGVPAVSGQLRRAV